MGFGKNLVKGAILAGLVYGGLYVYDYTLNRVSWNVAKYGTVENPKYPILKKINERGISTNIEALDSEAQAKKIFYDLTKRKFPDHVNIKREKINWFDLMKIRILGGTAIGGYSEQFDEIRYKNTGLNLGTLLHEMGHMSAEHMETTSLLPNDTESTEQYEKRLKETKILDEACAYAFENAGTYDFNKHKNGDAKNTEILTNGVDHITLLIKEYYNGEDDRGHHGHGAAIFLATLQVMKDPYKTFNYLATLKDSNIDNLDQQIKDKIEYNKTHLEE